MTAPDRTQHDAGMSLVLTVTGAVFTAATGVLWACKPSGAVEQWEVTLDANAETATHVYQAGDLDEAGVYDLTLAWTVSGATHHAGSPWRLTVGPSAVPGPVRIMPLGDSITSGELYPDTVGGYRATLSAALVSNGRNATLVGSLTNGPSTLVHPHHEGWSGYTIAQLAAVVDARIVAAHAQVVILHTGTNDAIAGSSTIVADWTDLVDAILAYGIALVVCTPVATYGAARDAILQDLADAMPAVVAARVAAGANVVLVDTRADWPTTGYLELDGIHPGATQYAGMGTAIYAVVASALGW